MQQMEIWLVILFLSRKKFHAKQMFVISSMKLSPGDMGAIASIASLKYEEKIYCFIETKYCFIKQQKKGNNYCSKIYKMETLIKSEAPGAVGTCTKDIKTLLIVNGEKKGRKKTQK